MPLKWLSVHQKHTQNLSIGVYVILKTYDHNNNRNLYSLLSNGSMWVVSLDRTLQIGLSKKTVAEEFNKQFLEKHWTQSQCNVCPT